MVDDGIFPAVILAEVSSEAHDVEGMLGFLPFDEDYGAFLVRFFNHGLEIESQDADVPAYFGGGFLGFNLRALHLLLQDDGQQFPGNLPIFEEILEDDVVKRIGDDHADELRSPESAKLRYPVSVQIR